MSSFISDLVRTEWLECDIAMINCGGFRANSVLPPGEFTLRYIVDMFPDTEPICLIKMNAEFLHEVLENAVCKYPSLEGRFPAVSGCRFAFNPNKAPGSRIDIASLTDDKGVPLSKTKTFVVAMKQFVAEGGDGFTMLRRPGVEFFLEAEDSTCVREIVCDFF